MNGSEITVYTMNYCPYCERAKALLKQKGIAFKEVLLGEDDDQAWEDLEKRSGMKTMPQIFKQDQLIGGYRELTALDAQDGLQSLK